jgi:hypothetical protein
MGWPEKAEMIVILGLANRSEAKALIERACSRVGLEHREDNSETTLLRRPHDECDKLGAETATLVRRRNAASVDLQIGTAWDHHDETDRRALVLDDTGVRELELALKLCALAPHVPIAASRSDRFTH